MKKKEILSLNLKENRGSQLRDLLWRIHMDNPKDETAKIIADHSYEFINIIAINAAKVIDDYNGYLITHDDFYYHGFEDLLIAYFIKNCLYYYFEEENEIIKFLRKDGGVEKAFYQNILDYNLEYLSYDCNAAILKKDGIIIARYNTKNLEKEFNNFLSNNECNNKKISLDVLSDFYNYNRNEINNILDFKQKEE